LLEPVSALLWFANRSGVFVLNAQVDNLEAKRPDAIEHAAHAKLVHLANQHSVRAPWCDIEISERLTASLTQVTRDGDPMSLRAHVASSGRE
jgi:hypothetical protein